MKVNRRKIKRVSSVFMKGALKTLAVTGVVGMIVVAPNALQALDKLFDISDTKRKRGQRYREHARRSGYFELEKVGTDRFAIRLTEKGTTAWQDVLFDEFAIQEPTEWDGCWHLLMFDVAEEYKQYRDAIARKVLALGMKPIQDSVYIYPFDVSEFAQALRAQYPVIAQYVIEAKVSRIDGEEQLKKQFSKLLEYY